MTEELEYADKTPDVQGGCPSNPERSCQSEQGEVCVCVCVFWYKTHHIFCLHYNFYLTENLSKLHWFIEHQNKVARYTVVFQMWHYDDVMFMGGEPVSRRYHRAAVLHVLTKT